MTRLRRVFESLGLAEVDTFIASGNVIFRSRSVKPGALERKIEEQLRKSLGFDVSTLIRSTSELSGIVGFNAFPDSETPTSSLYVGLLKSAPGAAERKKVLALGTPTDEFRLEGRELYWFCRTKSMASIVSGARLEKSIGMPATFRNVTTLRKLAAKYCVGVALACALAGGLTSASAQTAAAGNALATDTVAAQLARGTRLTAPFVKPLVISSLGDYFSVVGRFVGTLTVSEDSIAVQFDTLLATRVHHGGPVQVTRLDSIRVGVGRGTNRSWSPVAQSRALQVERAMEVGSRVQLASARFVLPHIRDENDAAAWLVVTFHLTLGRPGEKDYHHDASTYAHSVRGILEAPPSGPSATRMETGFLDRTTSLEGKTHRFQVFVPASYVPTRRWPVILFLHGAGERGNDGLLQTQVGIGRAIRENSSRFPAIVVMPQAPPDSAWTGSVARLALQALDQTMREFQADAGRVYLTGLSMGGNGVWYIAYRNPSRFAALAPICSWVAADFWRSDPVVPAPDGSALEALARRLRNVPVWIFHGEIDNVVPVDHSRKVAAALSAVGSPVQYTELPGIRHESWEAAYASPRFWTWLFAQVNPAAR